MKTSYCLMAVLIHGMALPLAAHAGCGCPDERQGLMWECPVYSIPESCPAVEIRCATCVDRCTGQVKTYPVRVRVDKPQWTDRGPAWYVNCQRYPYGNACSECP